MPFGDVVDRLDIDMATYMSPPIARSARLASVKLSGTRQCSGTTCVEITVGPLTTRTTT